MNKQGDMFKMSMIRKDLQLKEQEAQYKALQEEYFKVINSSFWRYTQWIRNIINIVRGTYRKDTVRQTNQPTAVTVPSTVVKKPAMDTRARPEDVIKTMKDCDIISFDVFDTLILRNCDHPTDIFELVAARLGYESFYKLRVEAEEKVREKSVGKEKEVSLSEIYDELCRWMKLDKEAAMQTEIDMELALCLPNPYMKKIFDTLRALGKTIIIVTDMYLPRTVIEKMLQKCGYFGYSEIYVSNELQKTKATGSMFAYINELHPDCSIIHTGDNYQSDVLNAQKNGWKTYYYPSARSVAQDALQNCESPAGSLYAGLCYNRLFAGLCDYSRGYMHGYAYGGLLSVGYCKWLEKFAMDNKADKILFLARDSEIFDVIFKKHIHSIDSKYVVVSRFSMWQIVFDIHTEEYIRFFFWSKASAEDTKIGDALAETGLAFLVDAVNAYDITADTILDKETYKTVREMIYDNRERISETFRPMRDAAEKYFTECFGDAKKVVVSDVGWSGQILLHMRHFVRDIMKRNDIEIIGAYMGTAINKNVNHYVNRGILNAYLFTYGQNRDMYIPNEELGGNTAVMCFEAMFSSVAPTLMLYGLDQDGKYAFVYGKETGEEKVINDIQHGIVDFADDWFRLNKQIGMDIPITPADAFATYEMIAMDWPYLASVVGDFKEYADSIPRLGKTRDCITLRQIMNERGLL